MTATAKPTALKRLLHGSLVGAGAMVLTAMAFLVLPVIQAITQKPDQDLEVRQLNNVYEEPPEDVFEEEPEEEEPEEEEPPELKPEIEPLDLAQLELVLNPGFGEGVGGMADFTIDLSSLVGGGGGLEETFGMDQLDTPARPVYQPLPALTSELMAAGGGTVYVLMVIDERGRVAEAKIQSSPHPVYEAPTLAAVKKWRFEPGKKGGKPVRSKRRAPVTFPEG